MLGARVQAAVPDVLAHAEEDAERAFTPRSPLPAPRPPDAVHFGPLFYASPPALEKRRRPAVSTESL